MQYTQPFSFVYFILTLSISSAPCICVKMTMSTTSSVLKDKHLCKIAICLFLATCHCLPLQCSGVLPEGNGNCRTTVSPSDPKPSISLADSRPWLAQVTVSCESISLKNEDKSVPLSSQMSFRTCEGALIHKNWIVTASTCLSGCKSLKTASITIDLGLHSNDILQDVALERKHVSSMNVDRIFVRNLETKQTGVTHLLALFRARQKPHHPLSSNESDVTARDIALLRLSKSVADKNRILPLSSCSSRQDERLTHDNDKVSDGSVDDATSIAGKEAENGLEDDEDLHSSNEGSGEPFVTLRSNSYLVSGWGGDDEDDSSHVRIMREARLELLGQEACSKVFGGQS